MTTKITENFKSKIRVTAFVRVAIEIALIKPQTQYSIKINCEIPLYHRRNKRAQMYQTNCVKANCNEALNHIQKYSMQFPYTRARDFYAIIKSAASLITALG